LFFSPSPAILRCGVFGLYGPAHVYSVLLVKVWAGKAFPIGSLRDGRSVPRAGRRIHKRGAKVASRSLLSRAVAGASPTGSNPAAKGACELRLSRTLKPCRAPTCELFRGHGAGETPHTRFHDSTACYPGGGRLRQLWSARHQGQAHSLFRSLGRGNPHNQAPLRRLARAFEGIRSPAVLRQRAPIWGLWTLGSANVPNKILGGQPRPLSAHCGRERSLSASTRGAHAARVGGLVPETWRGGPPSGKLSGGNWIGRSGPSWRSRRGRLRLGDASAPLCHLVTLKLRLSFGGGAPSGPPLGAG
jgi:hypothetical protein